VPKVLFFPLWLWAQMSSKWSGAASDYQAIKIITHPN